MLAFKYFNFFDHLIKSTTLAVYALCSPLSLNASRYFDTEEGHAINAIFGTRSAQEAKTIEANPGEFWHERAGKLKDDAITHQEFCHIYIKDAQEHIAKKIAQSGQRPWFAEPSAIEELIIEGTDDRDPFFLELMTFSHALACDHTNDPNDANRMVAKSVESMQIFIEDMKTFLTNNRVTKDLQDKQRWLVVPEGQFSMFDSMVMLGQGFYLGSVYDDPNLRMHSYAHNNSFYGWLGALNHDSLHAHKQNILAQELLKFSISAQEYINACFAPTNLVANDLVSLGQQTLGCFCNFHEEPSVNGAFSPEDKQSLLFPMSPVLSDDGFLRIVPYFSHVPKNHNWWVQPLPAVNEPALRTHATLLRWRAQYCSAGLQFL